MGTNLPGPEAILGVVCTVLGEAMGEVMVGGTWAETAPAIRLSHWAAP